MTAVHYGTSKNRHGYALNGFWANPRQVVPVVAVAGAACLGALAPYQPLLAAGLAIVPLLILSRELPVFWVLIAALTARTLFDGLYNRTVGGNALSALIGAGLVVLGISVAIRGGRLALRSAAAVVPLLISNAVAVEYLGSSARTEVIRSVSILAVLLVVSRDFKGSGATVVRCVQLVAATSAVFSLYQFVTHTGMFNVGVMRPAGTLAHPNSAALLYAIAALVSAVTYVAERAIRDLLLFAIFVVACVATASIGGLLTLGLMLVTYVLVDRSLAARLRLRLLLATIAVVVTFLLTSTGRQRLREFSGLNLTAGANSRNSIEWRVFHWEQFLQYWRESPLFGQGYGATSSGLLMKGAIPHNEYVRILVETGVVGFVILLTILVLLLRWLRDCSKTGNAQTLAKLTFAVTAGMAMNALGANTFLYSVPMYVFALLLGGTISVNDRLTRGGKTPPSPS